MPPVSREVVIEAVKEYGEAWVTQDPTRIGQLFTQDAVYVERAFDRNATFRGRKAIEKYWKYQICGKQSDISFRHVESEMVRDADEPIAVVKWLAEFQNHRANRADKTIKQVRFCQMAKLIFEGTKILYLEEYAQGMAGPAVRWPGMDDKDDELLSKIRFDPPKPPPPVACENCKAMFASRTKLFAHLRDTELQPDGQCVPNNEDIEMDVLVCLSMSYSSVKDPQQYIQRAFAKLHGELDAITWAVPTELTASAIVNVATVKLSEALLKDIPIEDMPTKLNDELRVLTQNEGGVSIHTAGIVSRPCAPERRDFEKYAALIPWTLLKTQTPCIDESHTSAAAAAATEEQISVSPSTENGGDPTKQTKMWRRPIEETKAFEFVDATVARRIKHAARLMRDYGNSSPTTNFSDDKLRVRTSTMEEPFHRFCKISISMRSSLPGCIERLLGLIVAYTLCELEDNEFVAALQDTEGRCQPDQLFPSECVILVEPAITRYETKTKLGLCRDSLGTCEAVMSSIDQAEMFILNRMVKNECLLEEWMSSRNPEKSR
jgi:hypothetical protein